VEGECRLPQRRQTRAARAQEGEWRLKVRQIDDFSMSGANSTTVIPEKLCMSGLHDLVAMARYEAEVAPDVPLSFSKEDFTGAFKTLPVREEDLPFSAAVWGTSLVQGRALLLLSLAFGAVGSVHGWERFARAVQRIAVRDATCQGEAAAARRCASGNLFRLPLEQVCG
jgi:hypothetical protein